MTTKTSTQFKSKTAPFRFQIQTHISELYSLVIQSTQDSNINECVVCVIVVHKYIFKQHLNSELMQCFFQRRCPEISRAENVKQCVSHVWSP